MKSQIKKAIDIIKKEKKVLALAMFGSSLKGKGRDIDLCIFLDKKYSNLEMSKIRLSILKETDKSLDIQIFQQLPTYIKPRVLKEGKILYCKNEDTLYEIAFQTIKEFGFYKKVYDLYLEKVQNG